MEKLGEIEMAFSSYYKYKFSYKGKCWCERLVIHAEFGGSADDIYDHEVSSKIALNELEFTHIRVVKDDETLYEHRED